MLGSNPGAAPAGARTRAGSAVPGGGVRIAFGGIGIALVSRDDCTPSDPEDARYVLEPGAHDLVAEVTCTVAVDSTLPTPPDRHGDILRSDPYDDRTVLRGSACVAELTTLGAGRYAASARVAPGSRGLRALLRGLSSAVLEREGGATLHAAGVEVDGRAVVYLGPSGAGKSTAARLTEDATSFADDHVALVPAPRGWLAWGLPGGSPTGMTPSARITFPVAKILRVRHGRGAPFIEPLSRAAALFVVRGALESTDCSMDAETARLSAAARIAREIEVATIHTVLGAPLTRELTTAGRIVRGSGST